MLRCFSNLSLAYPYHDRLEKLNLYLLPLVLLNECLRCVLDIPWIPWSLVLDPWFHDSLNPWIPHFLISWVPDSMIPWFLAPQSGEKKRKSITQWQQGTGLFNLGVAHSVLIFGVRQFFILTVTKRTAVPASLYCRCGWKVKCSSSI